MTDDLSRLHALLTADTGVNWVLTGDSITHGTVHTQGARTYVEHLHEIIRGDMGRVQDILINTAISGWRVTQLLEDFDRRVATWRPQVVTVMIGTNDASTEDAARTVQPEEFAASLTEFVTRVRALGAIPILQTPPSIDIRNAPERERIADFVQAIRDAAAAGEVILIDHFETFIRAGRGRISGMAWPLLADPFHPNAAGHAVIAAAIADALSLEPPAETDRVLPTLRAQLPILR